MLRNRAGWFVSVLAMSLLLSAGMMLGQGGDDGTVVRKGDNLVEVTVTGVGVSKDEALRDARRKAVEKGAGAYIYSQSKTENFMLVKDTILAKSTGFCQSVDEILVKELEDSTWSAKVKAIVSVKGIEDTWGVVQNLLKDHGRPKIMVFISEKVDGVPADISTVQTKIEELLLASGFLLVDKSQIKEIQKKDMASAVAEDKPDKLQAIAKQFGAQLFISGSVETKSAGGNNVAGIQIFKYGATGNVRCYQSDTAMLKSTRNGNQYMTDRVKNIAADRSLKDLGEKLGPLVQNDILTSWEDALQGRGEVKLEVSGVTFAQRTAIKKALEQLKQAKQVNAEFANNIATFSVQSDVNAEKLAEVVSEKVAELEVTDVSQNVIKATFKAKQ